MFDVIYITESQTLLNIKIDLKPGCELYFFNEKENCFKLQIETELRRQLNFSENNFLQIISISLSK